MNDQAVFEVIKILEKQYPEDNLEQLVQRIPRWLDELAESNRRYQREKLCDLFIDKIAAKVSSDPQWINELKSILKELINV